MPPDLEFTGERFVPGAPGEIVYEHVHRYAFARSLARGRRVLDAACGEGYGSALLAEVASEVTGVDIDPPSLAHARDAYRDRPGLRFVEGSVTRLPLADGSVDLVVSFETIEHLERDDQAPMVAEFERVLAPDGVLVLSSPNRPEYSERRNYRNPFHRHELDRAELGELLSPRFPAQRWFRQRIWLGSLLVGETAAERGEAWEGGAAGVTRGEPPEATYFVVVAARRGTSLPAALPGVSLFADREQSELSRHEARSREALRLEALAAERLAALDRQMLHIQHLERLCGERDAEIERRGRLLEAGREEAAGIDRERERLQRALEAQERIIDYRQSLRWWLGLPWLRFRLAWNQWRGR
jgi:SAM-dependent methyltransferase